MIHQVSPSTTAELLSHRDGTYASFKIVQDGREFIVNAEFEVASFDDVPEGAYPARENERMCDVVLMNVVQGLDVDCRLLLVCAQIVMRAYLKSE